MEENLVGTSENTISAETNEQTEAETIETETEVTPKTEETGIDNTAVQTDTETSAVESGTENTPFMTVKYNHEEKGLSQEEATALAQKGMKYEAMQSRLEYLAAIKKTTVDKLLSGLISEYEEDYKRELIGRIGEENGETVEDMLTLHRSRLGAEYQREREREAEAIRLEEKHAGDRLSEEFNEMRRDFPELSDLDNLPEEVKNAVSGGKPLLDAYLCHKHRENMRIAAEISRAKAVSQKTVGSLSTERSSRSMAEQKYLNALWKR